MATNLEIVIKIKTTWVKGITIFICRYIKKKWVLNLFRRLIIVRIYANNKHVKSIRLSEII